VRPVGVYECVNDWDIERVLVVVGGMVTVGGGLIVVVFEYVGVFPEKDSVGENDNVRVGAWLSVGVPMDSVGDTDVPVNDTVAEIDGVVVGGSVLDCVRVGAGVIVTVSDGGGVTVKDSDCDVVGGAVLDGVPDADGDNVFVSVGSFVAVGPSVRVVVGFNDNDGVSV